MILTRREIADRALEKVDLSSENTTQLNKVLDWIDIRYERIIRSHPWSELVRSYDFALINSQIDYSLKRDLDEILKINDITNGCNLPETSASEYSEFIAPYYDVSGNETEGDQPQGYYLLNSLYCKELMTISDTLEIVSSDITDSSPNCIRICGDVNGVKLCENIVLNGTTAVTSTNTYDSGSNLIISSGTIDGAKKSITGVVTVRETLTTANVKSVIANNDFATMYKWIRVFPKPTETGTMPTLRILYRKTPISFNNVNNIPEIDCSLELIQGAFSDLLKNDGDSSWQVEEQRFGQMVQELIKKDGRRPNYIVQFTPRLDTRKPLRRGFLGNNPYSV